MSRLHPGQIRLLSFLALTPSTGFVSPPQIEQSRQIRADDDLFVPSLVAQGWAEMGPQQQVAVRITDAGRLALVAGESGVGIRFRERKA